MNTRRWEQDRDVVDLLDAISESDAVWQDIASGNREINATVDYKEEVSVSGVVLSDIEDNLDLRALRDLDTEIVGFGRTIDNSSLELMYVSGKMQQLDCIEAKGKQVDGSSMGGLAISLCVESDDGQPLFFPLNKSTLLHVQVAMEAHKSSSNIANLIKDEAADLRKFLSSCSYVEAPEEDKVDRIEVHRENVRDHLLAIEFFCGDAGAMSVTTRAFYATTEHELAVNPEGVMSEVLSMQSGETRDIEVDTIDLYESDDCYEELILICKVDITESIYMVRAQDLVGLSVAIGLDK